ncbi:MAG: chromosome segregation protein SMC [Acidobacteria bacterium]|nr:chromosome segregation protein SMC [Acidobacteriota bacterium]
MEGVSGASRGVRAAISREDPPLLLKLKRIEIFGFKSFCDREELVFPGSGIASVVGPNGCGKSNISDAISWVLGEQSAKTLRGARMQDVIFNGSRDRKPSGMSTVSMTLFDPDPQPASPEQPTPKGVRPGEVTVTRKLFRSGESVYTLNGRNCRLRDIQDLFMGTGLGPNHYAIIEQGRIGQVLSSKPLDRRALIEEAAGVTKFKTRKRLAELKLESARQNLHRVNDILQEVIRQAGSLKRQAAKAKRYEEYRADLTVALTTLLTGKSKRIHKQLRAERAAVETARLALTQRSQRAANLEKELGEQRERQTACDSELQTGREELSRLTVETERLRSRIEQQSRTAEENESRKRNAAAEIASIVNRLAQLDQELAADQQAAAQVGEQAQQIQEKLRHKNAELEQRRKGTEDREREQESARKRVLALLGEASQLRNQLAKIEEFLAGVERNAARAREEERSARQELEQAAQAVEQRKQQIAERRAELETLQKNAKDLDARIVALQQESRERRKQADGLQSELSRLRARQESLDQILSHHAYTTETVKNIFRAVERNAAKGWKPMGVLADIVEVDPDYERAAEEFLREELEFVVVHNWDDARRGVELLLHDLQGHATFLVHPEKPVPGELPALGPETGVTGRLADHIHLQNGLAESASTLLPKLRGCYLVAEEEAAERLAVRYPDLYFLLPNGRCYRGYTVSGGRKSAAGPLALKRELRELRPKLAAAEKAFKDCSEAAVRADEQGSKLSADREQARREIQTAEKALLSAEHELRGLDEQTRRGQRRQEVAARELERLGKDVERANGEREQRANALAQRDREREEAEARQDSLREQLVSEQAASRTLAEEQTRLRAEAAALEERRRSAQSALARIRNLVEEQRQRRERMEKQAGGWEQERIRLLADNEQLGKSVKEQEQRRQTLAQRVAELTQILGSLRDGVTVVEQQLRAIRSQSDEERQALSRLELAVVRLESEHERLDELCRQELKRPVTELHAEASDADLSDEELSAAEETYRDVKDKIDKLGPVNVLALEEFEEAQNRQEFLETQQADLLTSIRDTQEAIHEIDSASRKQFQEAFEIINKSFQEVFKTLFGGGVGEMRLTDPDNVGESGIDIVASPPGKRLQNVALLSGGEKSLTALALLMATFKYKPSPFCVLDEVDAALDEPNILRFRRLLESMSDQTQFVIITHSKTTMGAASSLYGVTMQEPGVSRLVSVRLGEPQRHVNGRPAPEAQPALAAPVGV